MARFKPAGSRKPASSQASNSRVIPCAIIILLGFAFIFWLLYELLKSGK